LRTMLLIALLGLATAARASEWVAVTTTPEGDAHYYDRDKLHAEGSTVIYWRKVEFRMPLPVRSALASVGQYREQIDCATRNLRTLGYLYYSADGSIIENVYAPEAPSIAIADNTPIRQMQDLLCPADVAAGGQAPDGADELDKLRREVEALQVQVRKLRRGLELQEAAGSAR
jgi:hypothetical protein